MRAVALPPGRAEIEARFGLLEDGPRIVGAIVAALAAILLRHRGHQLAADRPRLGERHALLDRHGRVFPRRRVVFPAARPAWAGAGWRQSLEQRVGEEAVQPGALRVAERRVGRDDLRRRS